ncbi:MAG: penicillin-binding protein [Erysipelotrichaceae bacterium]|nr:penicillin-binding protein [Erysipelotrichaceae bacterium]
MNPKRANRTLTNISIICVIIAALVVCNVLYTMISKTHFRSGTLVSVYSSSAEKTRVISASRGYIYDRNKEIVAQDVDTYTIFAILDPSHTGIGDVPEYVSDPLLTSEKLAPMLNMEVSEMMNYFEMAQANNQYQTEFGLKGKNLSITQKEAIDALALPGIEFSKSSKRFYPNGKFASYLIGYAQYDDEAGRMVGRMGIESVLDEYLKGSDGEERYSASASGTVLPGSKYVTDQAVNGNDVYLTLDKNVQVALEKCLETTMNEFHAQRAWGVIVEVETGKILGYASYPTFDLNELDIKDYHNVPCDYMYEPGSVMKSITYAAAIDSGNFPYGKTYQSGQFYMGIANGKAIRVNSKAQAEETIYDAMGRDYGTISFEEGFARSSNVGIAELLTSHLPTNVFEEYLDRFNFFQPVDMVGVTREEVGVKNYTYPIEKLTTGFGQGSSVTAMQMVQAYTALFNDGKMMKPYFIDKIVNSYNGEVIEEYGPQVVGTPIAKETADKMKELMYKVVNDKNMGNYGRYHMDDVEVIGKTGTSEVAINGEYTSSMYVNSFMGAAPYDDPKVMMYYVFEAPDFLTYTGEPFQNAFRQALIATGVSGERANSGDEAYTGWQEYEMPALMNHSLDYVNQKMKSYNVKNIIIGDGSAVVKQYPQAQDTLISHQNVFIRTDGTNITMPDMSGWSLKDVRQYGEIAGLDILCEGSGSVREQSIKSGTLIQADMEIKVILK